MDEVDKPRCQSCGMPLGAPGFYGTNSDGSENTEYCKFCFESGSYTQPDMTVDQMIESSVSYMVKGLRVPEEKARSMSQLIIPTLKRWKNK